MKFVEWSRRRNLKLQSFRNADTATSSVIDKDYKKHSEKMLKICKV